MEIFLIIVLGIVVFSLWRSGQDAMVQLRGEIARLERELSFLREQLAAFLKRQSARSAKVAEASADKQPGQVPGPIQPARSPELADTVRTTPPASVAFSPVSAPAASVPPETLRPAPTRVQVPPPVQEAKPWFDAHSAPIPPSTKSPAPISFQQEMKVPDPKAPISGGSKLFSLEETLGANWLNKLGIAILVIGLAFFLAYKLQTWGPGGKVLCGYCVSFALLAGGVWLERKEIYRVFARGGIGGGWALAFFTTYAMYHVSAAHVLESLATDLVLMLLVASGMVAHSLRYRSQTVTGLAFLLGFVTLLTSHLDAADGTLVFSLTASVVLAVALVAVTTLRHWAWLELTGLIAVYLSHLVWLDQVLPENHADFTQFWPSTALILLYWLIFRMAYVLLTPRDQSEENISSLSAVLNSIGVLGLLKYQSAHPEWAFWALIGLGTIEMALAFQVRSRRRQAFVVLSTIATVLLVSAVPFKFHGVSWPVLWLVQAQLLSVCGLRLGEPVFRRLGLLAGVVTGGVLAFHDVLPLLLLRLGYPDTNRHISLTVALALAAILYWTHAEVYPRRWPQIAENNREALALRITSWLGVAAASTALWVVLPDLWVPTGWVALMLLLGFMARRFNAHLLALEADAMVLVSAVVLAFQQIAPLFFFRLNNPDPDHHPAETVVLSLAAIAYWIYSEVYPRTLPQLAPGPSSGFDVAAWQVFALPATSWLGAGAAAAALWVALPASWVATGWLALVVVLGLAADLVDSQTLALQCDLLTMAAIIGVIVGDLSTQGLWDHRAPLIAAVILLYAGMRRKTVLAGSGNYVAPAYSWAATLLLSYVTADVLTDLGFRLAPTPVWAALGLVVFEIGLLSRKGFLRWQGFFFVALSFGRYFVFDLPGNFWTLERVQHPAPHADHFSLVNSLLLEVLVLAASGYWLLERTRNREHCARRECVAGLGADALGTVSIAVWFAYRFPSEWVPVPGGEGWVTAIWAGMATALLALAWLMRRRPFLFQAMALVLAVVVRGLFVDLFAVNPEGFWHGPLFHSAVTAIVLLAGLPFAFRLRGDGPFEPPTFSVTPDLGWVLRRPEQWFFFAAFALEMIALAVKLTSGHITIAWSLLGLGVFLFALAVGERTFRLAGLGLLLVSVAKILLMDVWKLSPSDRYSTLIVLGLALLSVSFLYTRFGTVIRKLL